MDEVLEDRCAWAVHAVIPPTSRTVSRSANMFIKADQLTLSEFYEEIIEDELNVKKVTFTDDVRAFTSYTFKPQLQHRRTEVRQVAWAASRQASGSA